MLDVFKERLKAKSTAAGANLSQKRIDAMADRLNLKFPDLKETAEHDTKIEDLYDAETLKDFAAADDFHRAKDKREAEKKKEPEKKPEPEKQSNEDEPAWFKAYREQTDAKIAAFERDKAQGTIKQQLATKLKEVPANYYENWRLPEKEDEIEGFIEKVNTGYTSFTQQLTEKGLIAPGVPVSGTGLAPTNKKIDPAIASFVKTEQATKQQQVQKT